MLEPIAKMIDIGLFFGILLFQIADCVSVASHETQLVEEIALFPTSRGAEETLTFSGNE